MAKPINKGHTENSASIGRSFSYDGASLTFGTGRKAKEDFTESNDFLYITDALNDDYSVATALAPIDGKGGADQIIFKTDDLVIEDAYFTNFSNFEVVKLEDGTGSSIALDTEALDAGIREVSGGDGDDTITFGAAYDGDSESDPVVEATSVKVDGGDGDDVITTAGGDDTITGGEGADVIDGGAGNDVFVYAATGDTVNATDISGTSGVVTFEGGAEVIVNFGDNNINPTQGLDTIRLGAMDYQATDFSSFAALSITTDDVFDTSGDGTGIFVLQGTWDGSNGIFAAGSTSDDIDFLFVEGIAASGQITLSAITNMLVSDNIIA